MSVLKSKRNLSSTEYERAFFELYNYIVSLISTVSKRRQRWVCENISENINKACRNIMYMTTCYHCDRGKKREMILSARDECVDILLSLEKSLIIFWNIQNTEQRKILFCVKLINKELNLLKDIDGGDLMGETVKTLDWETVRRVEFLNNMSELHRYTYTKVVGANKAFDATHGTVLVGLVDDAFYSLIVANRKIPTTKAEYESRRENISYAISCLGSLNNELLFYFNLMKYSERIMQEWSSMLDKEIKLLHALQLSDKKRFSNLL